MLVQKTTSCLNLCTFYYRYEAFKTIGEKKACFNEYLQQRAKEEKEESRSKAKQNREAFFTLLELSPELKTGTRYSKAAAMFDDEPRWKVSKSRAKTISRGFRGGFLFCGRGDKHCLSFLL